MAGSINFYFSLNYNNPSVFASTIAASPIAIASFVIFSTRSSLDLLLLFDNDLLLQEDCGDDGCAKQIN